MTLLICLGTWRALSRGANDFRVFYEAWYLVLSGRGTEVYQVSPDRFLYAPGFAFLLSPLALFSLKGALVIWCLAKALAIGLIIKLMSERREGQNYLWSIGLSAWGVIWVARPVLIDMEYGQVNLLILGACIWGLLGHFDRKSSGWMDALRWCLLTFSAIAKLFPLPLLLVPWAITKGISPKKLRIERYITFFGALLILLVPVFCVGWDGAFNLLLHWREAVLARGLPLESHNQSFSAFLYHYLSGQPTHVLSEGAQPVFFGTNWLSSNQIISLSLFWTSLMFGMISGWIISGSNHVPNEVGRRSRCFNDRTLSLGLEALFCDEFASRYCDDSSIISKEEESAYDRAILITLLHDQSREL